MSGRTRLYDFELEPEVCDWLDGLSDSDFKRADDLERIAIREALAFGKAVYDQRAAPSPPSPCYGT